MHYVSLLRNVHSEIEYCNPGQYLTSDSMDSIYGNNIKLNDKNPIDFLRKMGRRIPRGIGFGSPDACECFRYAPDAGSADNLKSHKTWKFLFLRENGFRKNDMFIGSKQRTAKTEMIARTTRRYHVFITISLCACICQPISCFPYLDFRFSVRLIHFIIKSCSDSRVPR